MSKSASLSNNPLFRKGERIYDESGRDIIGLAEKESYMVSTVAEILGMTVREFEGALERSVGIRPKELFRNHRAVMARRMIQEGQDRHEISNKLGFRHYSHFATEIKKYYGIPPLQLRAVIRDRCDAVNQGLAGDK